MTAREDKANVGPSHLSGYRLMWMLVTFDLPVETKIQRARRDQVPAIPA